MKIENPVEWSWAILAFTFQCPRMDNSYEKRKKKNLANLAYCLSTNFFFVLVSDRFLEKNRFSFSLIQMNYRLVYNHNHHNRLYFNHKSFLGDFRFSVLFKFSLFKSHTHTHTQKTNEWMNWINCLNHSLLVVKKKIFGFFVCLFEIGVSCVYCSFFFLHWIWLVCVWMLNFCWKLNNKRLTKREIERERGDGHSKFFGFGLLLLG